MEKEKERLPVVVPLLLTLRDFFCETWIVWFFLALYFLMGLHKR